MTTVRSGEPENKPTIFLSKSVSEDRTHDVEIMKPTHYQLRYHRHVLEPTESPQQKKQVWLFESAANGRVSWTAVQWTVAQETKRPWKNGQPHSGPWVNGQWDIGTMELGEQAKGTMHHGTV